MQQVYRALSQPMMSTHICNSDGFIPLKQSIFSSSASSNLQISFDLFDNHVLPTLKHDHWIKHAWRQMDDWCDSGWMNVAQNLETILQICDVLQSADAAKAANAWGWGGIDRFEELICENCDRVLHNYYFAKVKTYLQNIYGAAQLHNNLQTNSGDGRAEEISSLIKSRTCWWDLVYCNGDSQPGYCQGCVSGMQKTSANCDCSWSCCNKLPNLSDVCLMSARVPQPTGGHVLYAISDMNFPSPAFPEPQFVTLVSPGQLWTCFRSQSSPECPVTARRAPSRGPHPCLDSVIYRPVLGALSCLQPPCHCIPRALSSPTPIWHETEVRAGSGSTRWCHLTKLSNAILMIEWSSLIDS